MVEELPAISLMKTTILMRKIVAKKTTILILRTILVATEDNPQNRIKLKVTKADSMGNDAKEEDDPAESGQHAPFTISRRKMTN